MPALYASSSRLVLALFLAGMAAPALAASFTVPPAAGQQSVSGSDTGTIDTGATLAGGGSSAIQWSAAATATPGVVITNNGTITSNNRTIDTASGVTGAFTLTNNGAITSKDDALRINGALADGTVTITNSGTISSQTGQAFDFDKATATTAKVSVDNSGTITSAGSDAIRLGGGIIDITNSGTIETTLNGKRAIKVETAANFDTLQSFTLTNKLGGVVAGTDDGIKISSTAGSTAAPVLKIDNAGTIKSTVDGQGIDLGGILSLIHI